MSVMANTDPVSRAPRTPIRLVCLDLAGTTVADGGSVLDAFTAALTEAGLEVGSPAFAAAHDYAIATMGQSKITVFRHIFASHADRSGDDSLAVRANKAFEEAYAEGLRNGGATPIPGARETIEHLRSAGLLVALTTGFSTDTRPLTQRRGTRPPLPRSVAHGRPPPPGRRCGRRRCGR